MNQQEIAYLAGIIDGEGTITLMKRGNNFFPTVSIANTSKELMDWCKLKVGKKACICRKSPRCERHTLSYHIRWRFDAALEVAELCLPYLIIKKGQAVTMLRWKSVVRRNGQYRPAELQARDRLVKLIRGLNSRPARKRAVENSL